MTQHSKRRPPARSEPPERFGPLTLTRHAKDDGRVLILYSSDERADVDGKAGPDAEPKAPER